MSERHSRILARLSELSLELAVDLQARALAAEDTDEAANDAREKAIEDDRTRPVRTGKRIIQVRKAVERLIWTEVENDEDAEIGVSILADVIDEFALSEDFLDAPIEALVQRLKDEVFGHLREDDEDDDAEEAGPPDAAPPLQNTG